MTWPAGYDRLWLDRCDSTMLEAARRAPGLSGPTWIAALVQTEARGRRGRVWDYALGNFAATLVMRPTETLDVVALRSFVTAVAVSRALADLGVAQGVTLKWPNDVLLNGGKLAGILLENTAGPRGFLAIGIGVNLASAPTADVVEAGALTPVSVLQETGLVVTPEAFLEALAQAFADLEQQFTSYGFAPVRRAWLVQAARLREEITARTGADSITGQFETVDDAGHLVLNTAKGVVRVAAGDVFF